MKEIITKLLNQQNLTEQEAEYAFKQIIEKQVNDFQFSFFCGALSAKGESKEELNGFINQALRYAKLLDNNLPNTMDIVGTGGDGGKTFNISTASAIVISAAGVPVAKHGNRAITGNTGSADVVSQLEISLNDDFENLQKMLHSVNMVFLNAPYFHSCFVNVAHIRKEIGIPTFFNLLGPLLNPLQVKHIVVGTPFRNKMTTMAQILKKRDYTHGVIIRSHNGLDEFVPNYNCEAIFVKNQRINTATLNAQDYGFKNYDLSKIICNSHQESKQIIEGVFQNDQKNDTALVTIALNAGLGLYISNRTENIKQGVELAYETIVSGKALEQLRKLQQFVKQVNSLKKEND